MAPATSPLARPWLSSPAGAKCAEQTLWDLWLPVLVVPSHVLGLRACGQAANIAEQGGKTRVKRVVRKKEQVKKEEFREMRRGKRH